MDLRVVNNTVVGLPDGNTTLLLVKASLHGIPCFYAVFGPTATLLPKPGGSLTELSDVKVAIFHSDGGLSRIHDACYGHWYAFGGGMVNTREIGSSHTITWTTPGERGITRVFGERIHPRDVLIAL